MRVFAIAHDFAQLAAEGTVWNVVVVKLLGKPVGDDRVVRGGARIGFGRKLLAQRIGHAARVRIASSTGP